MRLKGLSPMTEAERERLATLAGEYVAYVTAMREGQYADMDEWQRLSSERTLVHDELLRLTRMTRQDDMYAFCRNLLAGSETP